MKSLLVTPRDKKELKFLKELFGRMDIRYSVISSKDTEDHHFSEMMSVVDRKKRVSRASIIKKLKKA